MQIVHQFAASSHSLLPKYPLLPAPPVCPALPAPKISGLLAAPKLQIIVEQYDPLEEFWEKLGPIKSIEELDAELYAEMKSPLTRAMYDEIRAFNRARQQEREL